MSQKNFKITPFGAKTLTWWLARRKKIDMNPSYQRRGHLWSETDKAYLIDSILNEFDVPKIYIADFTWEQSPLNTKKLPYAIIDGKQRFEAIFDFFDGKIVLNDDFIFLDDPLLKLGGLGYKDLTDNHRGIADIFDSFNFSIMSVAASSVEPINDLFVRLNRSKGLTGAEIRNAMAGPAPQFIREIAGHEFFTTNIRFTVSRGQDLNAVAKILLFEYQNQLTETKKRNLDSFVKLAERGNRERLELAARRALDNLDKLASIFLPRDVLLGSGGILPIYYWFIRDLPQNRLSHAREFLVRFDQDRRRNRVLIKDRPGSQRINETLLEFDKFNRSTNDLQSHEERFRILKESFAAI